MDSIYKSILQIIRQMKIKEKWKKIKRNYDK